VRSTDSIPRADTDPWTVPQSVRDRFVQDGHRFYFPDGAPAFRDLGRRLTTPSENTQVIHSLIEIARSRGWTEVSVTGTERFRHEAWRQARLADPSAPDGSIRFLPSHPHEGAVSAPPAARARVIARGTSKATGVRFNIAVAFEADGRAGAAIAQSTFHHFADYNWDPRVGAPSFVDEPPGDGMLLHPEGLAAAHRYSCNVALWLAGVSTD